MNPLREKRDWEKSRVLFKRHLITFARLLWYLHILSTLKLSSLKSQVMFQARTFLFKPEKELALTFLLSACPTTNAHASKIMTLSGQFRFLVLQVASTVIICLLIIKSAALLHRCTSKNCTFFIASKL